MVYLKQIGGVKAQNLATGLLSYVNQHVIGAGVSYGAPIPTTAICTLRHQNDLYQDQDPDEIERCLVEIPYITRYIYIYIYIYISHHYAKHTFSKTLSIMDVDRAVLMQGVFLHDLKLSCSHIRW